MRFWCYNSTAFLQYTNFNILKYIKNIFDTLILIYFED